MPPLPGKGFTWADEDEEDEYLPPRHESAVDSKGVKSVVEWSINDDGKKVKTVTKVRVFTDQQRTAKACFKRAQWPLFGDAAAAADNSVATIHSKEEIMMETPQEAKEAEEQGNQVGGDLQAAMETMRKRNALRRAGILDGGGEAGPPMDDDAPSGGGPGGGPGGGSGGGRGGGGRGN